MKMMGNCITRGQDVKWGVEGAQDGPAGRDKDLEQNPSQEAYQSQKDTTMPGFI